MFETPTAVTRLTDVSSLWNHYHGLAKVFVVHQSIRSDMLGLMLYDFII